MFYAYIILNICVRYKVFRCILYIIYINKKCLNWCYINKIIGHNKVYMCLIMNSKIWNSFWEDTYEKQKSQDEIFNVWFLQENQPNVPNRTGHYGNECFKFAIMGPYWLLLSLISWYLNKYFEARNLHVTISNLLDCFTVIIPRRSMHACMLSHFSPVWLFMTLWIHNPPGFSVHGILQARILEWVAMPSSRGSSRLRDWTGISCLLH